MATYRTTVTSPHPPAEVFAYLADFSNIDDWDPNTSAGERIDPGELAVGSSFRVTTDFGRKLKLTYEIVELDPPRKVVLVAPGSGFTARDTITVEPEGVGSEVTYEAVVTMSGIGRLFDPLVGLVFKFVGGKAAEGLQEALRRESVGRR